MKLRQEHKEIAEEIAERITTGTDPAAALRTMARVTGSDMMKAAQVFRELYRCSPYDYKENDS